MATITTTARTPSSARVEALRARLAATHPDTRPARDRRLATGLAPLDRLLDGGLPLGRVIGWRGPAGAGLASLLHHALRGALAAGHRVAVVDGGRTLEPTDWVALTAAARLWFVRPGQREQAPWAAEVLARSGAFAVVAADLGSGPLPLAWQAHLRRAAREGGAALVVLGRRVGGFGTTLELRPGVFDPVAWRRTLEVRRVRGGVPAAEEIEVDVSARWLACRLPAPALVADRRPRPRRPGREGFTRGIGPR